MTSPRGAGEPIGTVDVRALDSLRWGPLRQLFPGFVEELELGRFLKQLLAKTKCTAVKIEPQRDAQGHPSDHVFDVILIGEQS